MLTDYRPVMLVDNIFHSSSCLQTFISTEKKITSYEWEYPCYNTEKGDGIIRFCNSVAEGQQLLEEDRDRLKQMEQLVRAQEQVR
jgi:hypothetical protein